MRQQNNNKYVLVALSPGKKRNDETVKGNTYYFGHDISAFDDSAMMHIDSYKNIFGVERNKARSFHKRLSVVRITYGESKERRSIYRKYRPCYDAAMKGKIAVVYHSVLFLKSKNEDIIGESVFVQKSNIWYYYWNHPNEIVHTSIILAGVSVFLGALSIILAIVL